MSIHHKINCKGNWQLSAPSGGKDYMPEIFARMIKRGYSKIMDNYNGQRIFYKQDLKTNYQEPRERDLFEEEQHEIERELRQLND